MKVMWIVCLLFIKGFLFVKEIFCFKKPSPLIKVQRMLSSRSWEMFTYDFDGLLFCVSRYHNCWSRSREIAIYGKGFHFWSCFCIIIRYQDFQSGLLWDSAQFSSIPERSFCIKKSLSSRSKELIIDQNATHCFMLIYLEESSLLIKIEIILQLSKGFLLF